MDGGWTTSLAASSPGVSGPHLYRQNSAESWVSVIEELVRWALSLRLSRTTASRNRLVRELSATSCATFDTIVSIPHELRSVTQLSVEPLGSAPWRSTPRTPRPR